MKNIMRIAMFLGVFASFPAAVLDISSAESGPSLFSGKSYDFGIVKEGEKVVHVFTVRNETEAPLRIRAVDLSEPGMKAKFNPVIPPGREGSITVELDTARRKGSVEAEAIVRLNEPAQSDVTLTLKGIVKPPIDIIPYAAVFFSVFKGESAERTVAIVNNDDRPLSITRLEADGASFAASVETIDAGKIYQLRVKVPPDVPPGRYMEAVYLHTDHPTRSRLRIGVNVFVKNYLYANPEVVDFGTVSLDQLAKAPSLLELLTQTFLVKTRSGEFEIKSIVSDVPLLHISKDPSGSSQAFQISVGLVRERIQPGRITGTLRITTDDEAFPELVVPVRGELR
jgi:hypothetical protein